MLARLEPTAWGLVDWAKDAALPLWATAGFDNEHGRFEVRLTLGGERLTDVPLRQSGLQEPGDPGEQDRCTPITIHT